MTLDRHKISLNFSSCHWNTPNKWFPCFSHFYTFYAFWSNWGNFNGLQCILSPMFFFWSEMYIKLFFFFFQRRKFLISLARNLKFKFNEKSFYRSFFIAFFLLFLATKNILFFFFAPRKGKCHFRVVYNKKLFDCSLKL